MKIIGLHSIFKDKAVISPVPNYFINTETPIICYKHNKPIRSTIYNFKKNYHYGYRFQYSRLLRVSKFDLFIPPAGHVITGNLYVIPDSSVHNIISKGPKIESLLILAALNVLGRLLLH